MRPGMSLAVAALAFALASEAVAGDISRQANQEYLEANARKPGVTVLSSGLQYRVIKSGAGQTPMPQDVVTVADLTHPLEVALLRRDAAPGILKRLEDHGGDGVGVLVEDLLLDLVGRP